MCPEQAWPLREPPVKVQLWTRLRRQLPALRPRGAAAVAHLPVAARAGHACGPSGQLCSGAGGRWAPLRTSRVLPAQRVGGCGPRGHPARRPCQASARASQPGTHGAQVRQSGAGGRQPSTAAPRAGSRTRHGDFDPDAAARHCGPRPGRRGGPASMNSLSTPLGKAVRMALAVCSSLGKSHLARVFLFFSR